MIFYTLKGPRFSLEIHAEKIKLVKRSWSYFLTKTPKVYQWSFDNLSTFSMTAPHYFELGKLEWQSKEGHTAAFRFTTDAEMVKRIERYVQEKITKVEKRKNFEIPAIFYSPSELQLVKFKTVEKVAVIAPDLKSSNVVRLNTNKASKLPKKYRKRAA